MQISVSYLSSLYDKEKTIELINKTDAQYIHVDLMDGGFVSHKNFTINEVLDNLKDNKKPIDIHLMVFDPIIYIEKLATLKPEYITFHLEATKDIIKTIELIKNLGIKAGIALNPETNIMELMPYISFIDLVLVMSVAPGEGGQKFLEGTKEKLKDLIAIRKSNNLKFKIEVDGGINKDTIPFIKDADIAVSGSYICKNADYQLMIDNLKSALNNID